MRKFCILTLFLLSSWATAANSANPVGFWQLNDARQQPLALIYVYRSKNNTLSADLIRYFPNAYAKCTRCTGKLKNRSLQKFPFITALQPAGDNQWRNGLLLNPQTGKTTKVKLTLSAQGRQLKIVSYRFISWFGNAKIWSRRK